MAPTLGGAAPLQNSRWSQLWVELEQSRWGVWPEECYQLQKRPISVWIAIVAPEFRPHLSSSLSPSSSSESLYIYIYIYIYHFLYTSMYNFLYTNAHMIMQSMPVNFLPYALGSYICRLKQ
uniref:Uncharacterized protein n=1 Tax=Setaria viridis TaxID=4556 RepID=A0A4U6TMR0_SETVI|nr:hypothetical protein SEVIR_7G002500v2 [Setaria viridis]